MADRFDRIRAALDRLPVHTGDPDTAREAARIAVEHFREDERKALAAIVSYPLTAPELELVFPHWRPGHAAKRLSELKCRLGLAATTGERRLFPGHTVASSVYFPTRMGRACADEWPARNAPVEAIVAGGLARVEAGLSADAGTIPCLFCPHLAMNRNSAVRHLQRAHGMPRIDPATGRPYEQEAA